jgi:hypothetical protein
MKIVKTVINDIEEYRNLIKKASSWVIIKQVINRFFES